MPVVPFLSFFLLSCSYAKPVVFENVKDLNAMSKQIALDHPNELDTLVIFDIDDTLLENRNFVGSGKWYNWQRGRTVSDASGNSFVIDKNQQFYCIFRALGTMFEIASTELTQPNAVEIFNNLKNYDLMILTARTAKFRPATERELKKNGIELADKHLSSVKQGLSFQLNDTRRTDTVTYSKGIVMSSGLNKGLVLKNILGKANRTYKNIYFIDDSAKNVKQMSDVWKNSSTNFKIFHYMKVDKSISKEEIRASDDAKVYFHQFLNSAYPDQYQSFESNKCN